MAADASSVALKSMADSRRLLVAGTVLMILLSAELGLLITRSLTQPLGRATESIAGGSHLFKHCRIIFDKFLSDMCHCFYVRN